MKAIIDGKLYKSENCEDLAEKRHYNNGNYSGTSTLMRASDGTMLIACDTNGQDCYLTDSFEECHDVNEFLRNADTTSEQDTRLIELGIVELVKLIRQTTKRNNNEQINTHRTTGKNSKGLPG